MPNSTPVPSKLLLLSRARAQPHYPYDSTLANPNRATESSTKTPAFAAMEMRSAAWVSAGAPSEPGESVGPTMNLLWTSMSHCFRLRPFNAFLHPPVVMFSLQVAGPGAGLEQACRCLRFGLNGLSAPFATPTFVKRSSPHISAHRRLSPVAAWCEMVQSAVIEKSSHPFTVAICLFKPWFAFCSQGLRVVGAACGLLGAGGRIDQRFFG